VTDAGPAALEVGAELELEVGDIAGGGGCVARAPDGRVVFVRHSLPGERVVATVTSTTSSFIRADATDVLRPSPDRVTPPCPYAGPGRCGGCDFQHIDLAAQRRLKASRVAEQLQRVAGVTRACGWTPFPATRTGSGGAPASGWASTTPDSSDSAGIDRTRWSSSTTAPSPAPVMETGTFAANWPGVDELEIIVAPDTGESLIAVDVSRRPRPPLPAGVGAPGRQRAPSATVGRRAHEGVRRDLPCHVGACSGRSMSARRRRWPGAVRAALGAGPGDDVVDLYAGAGLFSVLLADDVGARGRCWRSSATGGPARTPSTTGTGARSCG
jgi:predicted RNA-binding protein with TRAM domain